MLVWNAKISHDSANKVCMGYETATVPEEHLRAIQAALDIGGIDFTSGTGSGVRLRKGEQRSGEA